MISAYIPRNWTAYRPICNLDDHAGDVVLSQSSASNRPAGSKKPEILAQPSNSRALHVKQGNLKTSRSGSRSSGSSSRNPLPPLMDRSSNPRDQTHRGPGSLHLQDQRSVIHRDEQRVLQVNQDQRSVVHHHEHQSQVNQEQRSFVHVQDQRVLQVNVGVAPDHAMDRETHIISQAHAAVNEARTQSVEVQQQTQDHVRNIEIQTQVSVEGANARALAVESRAHDLLTEFQTKHQSEINQLQNVANESHHESQQRLLKTRAENQRLLDWIQDQKK